MTRYQLHVENWKDCLRCPLGETRNKVCIGRGTLPCDVLFIGEAPGISEDVLGKVFIGQAGKVLDSIIRASVPQGVTYAMTNLVGCFPLNGGAKGEPGDEAIKACAPRVMEFAGMAKPKIVICVGKLSGDWLATPYSKDTIKLPGIPQDRMFCISHPAAILRANPAARGLMVQRCVVTIKNSIRDLL
jgi:uracil-DNA glycosylase family 4